MWRTLASFRSLATRIHRVDKNYLGNAKASALTSNHVSDVDCNDPTEGPTYVAKSANSVSECPQAYQRGEHGRLTAKNDFTAQLNPPYQTKVCVCDVLHRLPASDAILIEFGVPDAINFTTYRAKFVIACDEPTGVMYQEQRRRLGS